MTRCKAFRRFGRTVALILAAGVVLAGARPLAAQPAGTAFTYQGRLSDNGTPVTGTYDLQFALFTASAGGTQVGLMLSLGDVAVVGGLFTVNLDFGVGAFAGSARFLEIGVRPGASTGAYTLLGARQELKPSPQAVFSQTSPWAGLTGKPAGFADDVDNDSGGDITGVTVGTGLTGGGAAGAVSVGLDFPAVALNHNHAAQTWNTTQPFGLTLNNSVGSGLLAQSTSSTGYGVQGVAQSTIGPNAGVHGVSNSSTGAGILGSALTTNGSPVGVLGLSDGRTGIGVDGQASGTAAATGVRGITGSTVGRGVFGWALATAGTPVGVRGEVAASNGVGVEGISLATGNGTAILGRSLAQSSAYGVIGLAEPTGGSGIGTGVYGRSERGGYGVYGVAPFMGNSVGVEGTSSASDGIGVRGISLSGAADTVGVYGTTSSPLGRAVWGRSPTLGHAGWFDGAVNVVGTLSKSAGSFKIDHPLDPENKYLYHSFVESPEMMNVYTGNVTTDADGFATVALADWFEALNRDFRYQLTVLDDGDSAGFVQVKVTRKIAENRFTIRTSTPRVEVSWLVTGVRKDAYAEKHRIPVEEWKAARDRGRYIHAAEWGRPPERGEGWERQKREDERPAPPSPDRD